MGATKINHEQNHIGAIVDYLGRIDRGGLHRDTEILRYWISITAVPDIVVRGRGMPHNSVSHYFNFRRAADGLQNRARSRLQIAVDAASHLCCRLIACRTNHVRCYSLGFCSPTTIINGFHFTSTSFSIITIISLPFFVTGGPSTWMILTSTTSFIKRERYDIINFYEKYSVVCIEALFT